MKRKIVYIAPHLSTGGLPQYLYKQIESIKDHFDVYCIEWDNVTGGVLVVQRNKIENLLKDRLITLPENKNELYTILERINPDIVHLQEIPELFMGSIADKLYSSDRNYVIIETSHDSSTDVNNKKYFPDKFLMVSNYQIEQYKSLGIPCELAEYPIERKTKTRTREEILRDLGLDPSLKHVVNVGLFTPRKNQAEIIEYARKLEKYPIQFHFIGNQADNFRFYWEPLMQNLPSNCKWWNERSDVDTFYEAADLFLFTSRGTQSDKETMPLVIREAIGWDIPSLIYNLPVYLNYFDKFDNIEYLNFDSLDVNVSKIMEKLQIQRQPITNLSTSCAIISAYPNTETNIEIVKQCIERLKKLGLKVILTSHMLIPEQLSKLVDYTVVDSNNILTTHTYYSKYWYNNDDPKFRVEIDISKEKNNVYHGPAVYTNYYNGMLLAYRLGFENAYCMNFDILLNNDTSLVAGQTALENSQGLVSKVKGLEGETIKTFWFTMKTKFFLENFPTIENEQDYNTWVTEVQSESNGLENVWYHTLKHKLHDLTVFDEDTFYNLFSQSIIDICSQVEYTTILPIKNDDNSVVIWYTNSNNMDGRILNIWENDTLIESLTVYHKSNYYKIIQKKPNQIFKFEFLDNISRKVVSTKEIILDSNYNLYQNGLFTYENS